jgi:hypothetical protein
LFENHPIGENVLPSSLETLILYTLPQSLKVLRFGEVFNQPIDKDVLPKSLKELHFGCNFNQPIGIDILPRSLKQVHFGSVIQPIL